MKKPLLFLAILICLLTNTDKVMADGQRESLKIELTWNFNKNLFQNFLSTENLHTGYNITACGIRRIIKPKNLLSRTTEIGLALPFSISLSVLNHEGGHEWVAIENGALETWIEWNLRQFWTGKACYVGKFSKEQKAKFAAAGLIRQNQAATRIIDQNLGKTITISELMWFANNQRDVSSWFITTSKPRGDDYGLRSHDVEMWIANVADFSIGTMNSLYDDVTLGAVWQKLGLIVPAFAGIKYWLFGKEFKMPNWYLNPQAELTDAGVMYALGIWYQLDNDIMLKIRPGWGRDRIQDDTLIALEIEASDIPLPFWGTKGRIRGGFSKTLKTSALIGISMEKPLSGKIAIGIDANYYSGYHRHNPRANGSYSETIVKFKFFF